MGCHFLLQGNVPTQGSNPNLLHWQANSLPLSHLSYPASEVRGTAASWARDDGWEELLHVQGVVAARAQEDLEDLLHVEGQEGWQ